MSTVTMLPGTAGVGEYVPLDYILLAHSLAEKHQEESPLVMSVVLTLDMRGRIRIQPSTPDRERLYGFMGIALRYAEDALTASYAEGFSDAEE